VVDDLAGFNKRQHIAIFAGKDYIRQRKRLKDIGKPLFTSFSAFGNSRKLAKIVAVEGYN
jgi:hypothetical protein